MLGISLFVHRYSEHRILTHKSIINLFSDSIKENAEQKLLCILPYEASPYREPLLRCTHIKPFCRGQPSRPVITGTDRSVPYIVETVFAFTGTRF